MAAKSKTGAQSVIITRGLIGPNEAVLDKRLPVSYETYRKIRKHPTVALARAMRIAPSVAAGWAVEADDDIGDEVIKFIQDQLMPIREPLVQTAIEHGVDYGWAPFEKIFESRGDRVVLRKLKPLLVDLTDIRIHPDTGSFLGFRQAPRGSITNPVELETENSLLINFRIEGDNHYGAPLLENIRRTYANWEDANAGAERYDKKIAGSLWVVHFPDGRSNVNGAEKPNHEIAAEIVSALEASGSVAVPRQVSKFMNELNQSTIGDAWDIELKDHTSKQASFVDRMNYCDKQFARGLLMPERTILEGQFGTKAEAGVHTSLAMSYLELEHRNLTRQVNWHLVDQLLVLNFGESFRSKVRLVASPLVNEKLTFFRDLLKLVLSNPVAGIDAIEGVDLDALFDLVEVPKAEEVVDNSSTTPGSGLARREMAKNIKSLYDRAAGGLPADLRPIAGGNGDGRSGL